MGWKKTPSVAQYGGADWSNLIHTEKNCTVEKAKRIAMLNPNITFFFFCNGQLVLDGHGTFDTDDAVFFSGEPWYGSAPQCDAYQKEDIAVLYINPNKSPNYPSPSAQFRAIADQPGVDIVSVFGANYVTNTSPYLRAENNPHATNQFNDNIQSLLDNNDIAYLQEKGIVVLLTILNGHQPVGWSQFTKEQVAEDFANYLKNDVVDKYGFDGIDIDDEYSSGTPNDTSLIMVTSKMRAAMPDKLITKALFDDTTYFQSTWQGKTLAENLDYGWEMSYFSPQLGNRLSQYLAWGMKKNELCLGFSAEDRFSGYWSEYPGIAQSVIENGFLGSMLFAYENQPDSVGVLNGLLQGMSSAKTKA